MIDAKRSLRRYPVRSRFENRVNGCQLMPIQQLGCFLAGAVSLSG